MCSALLQKEAGGGSSYHANIKDEILIKFRSFKQFDIAINDASNYNELISWTASRELG